MGPREGRSVLNTSIMTLVNRAKRRVSDRPGHCESLSLNRKPVSNSVERVERLGARAGSNARTLSSRRFPRRQLRVCASRGRPSDPSTIGPPFRIDGLTTPIQRHSGVCVSPYSGTAGCRTIRSASMTILLNRYSGNTVFASRSRPAIRLRVACRNVAGSPWDDWRRPETTRYSGTPGSGPLLSCAPTRRETGRLACGALSRTGRGYTATLRGRPHLYSGTAGSSTSIQRNRGVSDPLYSGNTGSKFLFSGRQNPKVTLYSGTVVPNA
ncbi:hypothetical protein SAMN05444422_102233 [Halobiforma haloterrestris]|uniref:Uncharacterized protein n=1 Tax=Natronobacterium haloterrestre TaxID=148448 RepID=A0A1I1E5N0_NATHA|nr:hypothetical protein SAMN05444422_102233 [Halobiforma haloterrestris]